MRSWNGFWTRRTDVQRVDLYTRVSLYSLVWFCGVLVPLSLPAAADASGPEIALVVLVAVVTSLAATHGMRLAIDGPHPTRLAAPGVRRATVALLGLAVLAVLASFAVEPVERVLVLVVVASGLAWGAGAVQDRVVAWGTPVLLVGLGLLAAGGRPAAAVSALVVYLTFLFTLRASLWLLRVVRELDDARQSQSLLAVAEERLRFSRDVHDVLGRHLSTIAVRAELAATLAPRDTDRAAAEMLEVRAAAQEALREARALARGYRTTDLAAELQGARSLLAAAGIRCDAAADEVPEQWHEAAGWVIREAVTNVLRHSAASVVEVRWASGAVGAGTLVVENDGVADDPDDAGSPAAPSASDGTGLIGLAERLAPLGGTVERRREGDRFVLEVTLPAAPIPSPSVPAPEATP